MLEATCLAFKAFVLKFTPQLGPVRTPSLCWPMCRLLSPPHFHNLYINRLCWVHFAHVVSSGLPTVNVCVTEVTCPQWLTDSGLGSLPIISRLLPSGLVWSMLFSWLLLLSRLLASCGVVVDKTASIVSKPPTLITIPAYV